MLIGLMFLSLEENKAIVRSLYEADNKKDLRILDDLISPDFYDPSFNLRGSEDYKKFELAFFKGFPDWIEAIENIIAEEDKVWVRFTATGTHMGEWLGLAPTGKKVTVKAVQMWRMKNGKVAEKDAIMDLLDTFVRLGVIEYTEKAKTFLLFDGT
jgi:C-1 hydroxylase